MIAHTKLAIVLSVEHLLATTVEVKVTSAVSVLSRRKRKHATAAARMATFLEIVPIRRLEVLEVLAEQVVLAVELAFTRAEEAKNAINAVR